MGDRSIKAVPENPMKTRWRVLAYIWNNPTCSQREIMRGVGVKSASVAAYHVESLVALGLLKREQSRQGYNKARGMRVIVATMAIRFLYDSWTQQYAKVSLGNGLVVRMDVPWVQALAMAYVMSLENDAELTVDHARGYEIVYTDGVPQMVKENS